jgi:tripartite-type tricarboxylate transporter receptor subunit TctC
MPGKAAGLLTTIALIFFGSAAAHAQEALAQFYKGRQITVVIPSSVGGGYDLYGRLIARTIGKYIPGNPAVVASNMAGAAGVVATQYVYSSAPKDGTVLGEVYPNAILDPLLGDKSQVKYDAMKFNYIGSASADTHRICFVRANGPIRSFADAFTHEAVLGASGVGAAGTDYPSMYDHLLGAKFKIIPGYPGMSEIGLAIMKGEIDGTCGTSWSTMTTGHPEWLRDGTMRVIAQESLKSDPEIEKLGAPLTISFAKTEEARQVMQFVYTQPTFGRPFVMAPEVPADRIEAVRHAFAQALQDPGFLAEAQKLKLDIEDPMTGAQLEDVVRRLMATPADIVEKTKEATRLDR